MLEPFDTTRGHGTEIHHQRFEVSFDYPVYFTERLFDPNNPALIEALSRREPLERHRCLVFIDEGLCEAMPDLAASIEAYAQHHRSKMALVAKPLVTLGGERIKTELFHIEDMQQRLHRHHIDRHAFVIAIGGGALLDAVGLAAATVHRGVRLIRVPTTVLGQNDSGVGVKNGVNHYGIKNFIGTFAPPFAVLNDLALIDALPPRDKIAGMAEAVKVALIRDEGFFGWLEQHADDLLTFKRPAMAWMIKRAAQLHMHQIAKGGDPFETGSARPLDFGHWSAHKLEAMTRHHVRHGEAVAIGIALDARYAVLKGLLAAGLEVRIAVLLEHLGFRLWHPALASRDSSDSLAIMEGLSDFQEHLGGKLTVTLLADIGRGIEVHEIDHDVMETAFCWLEDRDRSG